MPDSGNPPRWRLTVVHRCTGLTGGVKFVKFYDSSGWLCLMAHALDMRRFFQRVPRKWLQRYFRERGVLQDFDWTTVRTIKVDTLVEAWLNIEEDLQQEIAEDFCNIEMLASTAGKSATIDESSFWGEAESVAATLSELEDLHACAFWTLLEKRDYWDNVLFLAAADLKASRYWRQRSVPLLGRETTGDDGKRLEKAIIDIFMRWEARGRYCSVHQIRRGEREYYFAYPQDHRQTSIEYEHDGRRTKRRFNPAFEIIFVHNDDEQKLRIWHSGSGERVKDLQVAFAAAVLGEEIPRESPKDTQLYDLSDFAGEDFQLEGLKEFGIKSAEIRQLRIQVLGENKHTIKIELGSGCAAHVLHDRLRGAVQDLKPSMWRVSQVKIRVSFELQPWEKKARKRDVNITWPNLRSLQNEGDDLIIQQMLVKNGIEPRNSADTGNGDDA